MLEINKELANVAKYLSLLYVEDERDSREQYESIFKLLYKEVKSVENGKDALAEYKRNQYDLVITDLTMPQMNGIDMIGEILKINPHQHIIIITAHNTNENLKNSIEFQVDGILLKPVTMDKLFQLLYKVSHLIYVDKKDRQQKKDGSKLSNLLGDENHAFFVVVVDKFSDIVKHFGNETKKFIAESVEEHLQNFGVEEENILLLHDDVILCGVSKQYVDDILEAVQAFTDHNNSLIIRFKDLKIYITLSYGLILVKQSSSLKSSNEEFLFHINSIVDNIKSDANSNLVMKMDVDVEEAKKNNALTWLGVTLEALKQETIVPFYQPIVDIDTRKTVAYEVFARIKQGNKYILPEFFIDLSQKAGILEDISQSIFKQCFEKLAPTEFSFHINLTDAEWKNSAIKDYIVYLSKQYNVDFHRIILDIIHYESFNSSGKMVTSLLELKELGCKIALKEFATTNINIELLSILKPEYIKINQMLLQKSLTDKTLQNTLEFLLKYINNMGIKSILVAVETEEILNEAKKIGIDYIQGYLIKQPSSEL